MESFDLPGKGGTVVLQGTPEQIAETKRVLTARYEFTKSYCEARGWEPDGAKLTIEQILEIRAQEGWKKP